MDILSIAPTRPDPEAARLAACDVCHHAHACFVSDVPAEIGAEHRAAPSRICLGCLMRLVGAAGAT